MSQTRIKRSTDIDFIDAGGTLESDYKQVIALINRLEELTKQTAVDKHLARLGDILEGIYLLRKVMGIEGIK